MGYFDADCPLRRFYVLSDEKNKRYPMISSKHVHRRKMHISPGYDGNQNECNPRENASHTFHWYGKIQTLIVVAQSPGKQNKSWLSPAE